MTYARDTDVTPSASKAEIERDLGRFGATGFLTGHDDVAGRAFVGFQARDRQVRMFVPLPTSKEMLRTPTGKARTEKQVAAAREKETRRRWRALALAIKAKLVAITDGVETFEDAFMPYVVMPDGSTVGDQVRPAIASAYSTGTMPKLLPGPTS